MSIALIVGLVLNTVTVVFVLLTIRERHLKHRAERELDDLLRRRR